MRKLREIIQEIPNGGNLEQVEVKMGKWGSEKENLKKFYTYIYYFWFM